MSYPFLDFDFLGQRGTGDITRAARQLELWKKWKEGGKKPKDMEPLIKEFEPYIKEFMGVYREARVPSAALELEIKNHIAEAINRYDPSKANLGTYVKSRLRKVRSWVAEHQNLERIPENRVFNIGKFTAVKSKLMDELGREPTTLELAEELKWPTAEVSRMQAELKPYEFGPVQKGYVEPASMEEEEFFNIAKYELTPQEQLVFEYILGLGGKPALSPGEIARKLNLTSSEVSRIKERIAKKLKPLI